MLSYRDVKLSAAILGVALIAEVAITNGYVLVTTDTDLAIVAQAHGCKVLHYAP